MEIRNLVQAKCECGCEIMEVEYDKEDKTFMFVHFFYSRQYFPFLRRLRFLFTGYLPHNEIILNCDNAKYIADYLNEYLPKNEQKKKKKKLPKRPYKIPRAYLLGVADQLHKINPTLEIVYNTIKDVYCVASDNSYQRCLSDAKFRRDKKDKRILSDFKRIQDEIDDLIHNKAETNK